jgi:hypothetical protein
MIPPMARLRRILFRASVALSVVLFGSSLIGLTLSYFHTAKLPIFEILHWKAKSNNYTVGLMDGSLYLSSLNMHGTFEASSRSSTRANFQSKIAIVRYWGYLKIHNLSENVANGLTTPPITTITSDSWLISFLWPLFLSLPLTAISVRHFVKARTRRRRQIKNLCIVCGYDLRATPNLCPECGTVPAAQN